MRIKYLIFSIALILILAARIAMPYIILRQVTTEINKSPDYHVKIADASMSVIRGSYSLKGMKLDQIKDSQRFVLFQADTIHFAIEWGALFKGKLVSDIKISNPIINTLDNNEGAKNKSSGNIHQQWREAIKPLMLMNINQIAINNGTFYFKNPNTPSPFTLYIKNIEFKMANIQNVQHNNQTLPGTFNLKGKVMKDGDLQISGKFSIFTRTPAFAMEASLKSLSMPPLNPFLKHYTAIQAKQGNYSLFVEAAAASGKITGYAKPFLKDFEVKESDTKNPVQKIYEGAVSVATKILENNQQKTVASQIKIRGNLDDPDTSMMSVMFYLLRHAFIQALLPQIDQKVKMQDILYSSEQTSAKH